MFIKLLKNNLEEYTQHCFHLIQKVRITGLIGLIFYLYFCTRISHKILTKKCYFYNLGENTKILLLFWKKCRNFKLQLPSKSL